MVGERLGDVRSHALYIVNNLAYIIAKQSLGNEWKKSAIGNLAG
jgi:hypothetical protein